MLRHGIIAFEDPTEIICRYFVTSDGHVRCFQKEVGEDPKTNTVPATSDHRRYEDIHRVIVTFQFRDPQATPLRVRKLLFHFCYGRSVCATCNRPMPEPLHIPTLDGIAHPGQLPNVLVDLPDA